MMNRTVKQQTTVIRALTVIFACMVFLMTAAKTEAAYDTSYATNSYTCSKTIKAGNLSAALKYTPGGNSAFGDFTLTLTSSGTKKLTKKNVLKSITMNGRYLYYAVDVGKARNYCCRSYLYRYDVKTGKQLRLAIGIECMPVICNGTYLYYTVYRSGDTTFEKGPQLYRMNLSTKKSNMIMDDFGAIRYGGARYIILRAKAAQPAAGLYVMKLDGTNKKMIANRATHCAVKNGRIYYQKLVISSYKAKVISCTMTGGDRRELTGYYNFTGKTPSKYWSMFKINENMYS